MRMRLLSLIGILLGCAACVDAGPPQSSTAVVKRVVDGDTVVLRIAGAEERARVVGIDTPEVHESGKLDLDAERTGQDRAVIQALGKRASVHAKALLEVKTVVVEFGKTKRDKYDRPLVYLTMPDDRDFGEVMT